MRFVSEPLDLPLSAFVLLRDLIHEQLGVYYEDSKRYILADKLSPRVIDRGLDTFLDYYYLLKYDVDAEQEWKQVINQLSVQETFFFFFFDQINALLEVVLPEYYNNNWNKPLKIWSAGCASGEEPITIAIALNEAGWFKRMQIQIYASDASSTAIAKAKQGIYRERAFRSLSPILQAKYFTKAEGGWKISPEIQTKITWEIANLVSESEIKYLAKVPIIFCRNVFIYFSENSIRKTVHLFFKSMDSPGYLFVGASESLLKVTTDFEFQEIGGAFVYVKK